MSTRARSRIPILLRLTAGAVLLALIVWRVDLGQFSLHSWPALLAAAGAAVVLLLVAQVLSAVRWHAILGTQEVGTAYLWRLYLIGQFFGLFLPSLVGGDAVRAVALSREIHDASRSVASVLVDRIVGMVALVLYLVLGLALVPTRTIPSLRMSWPHIAPLWWIVGAIGVLGATVAAFLVLRRSERVRRIVGGKMRVLRMVRQPPLVVARWIGIGLLVQGIYILTWWALDIGLHLGVGLQYLLFAVPLVNVVAMLPITFSGIGVREGAWVVLLAPLGVSGADAVAFGVLYFLCYTIVGGIGGLIFMWRGTTAHRGAGGSPQGLTTPVELVSYPPPSRVPGAE
ncbi:MAG TPA: lysylphosphatidylglycerol synthase transmembrane domain-containing protein [Gemmatimonadaceae bacterium]|nr:lysylphosphatidylglycerol synthase transmembrane domain-containing protein [Gemmatimonadaceae bacterium]